MKKLVIVLALAMLGGCSDDNGSSVDTVNGNGNTTTPGDIALLGGLQMGATVGNVAESIGLLETALNNNPALTIVAQVDHQANAANAGLELRPTRVTLFGNPNLGTPLMQVNQLAGLDLPQKMFAWTDETGQSNIAYNSADYLSGRHGLSSEQTVIDTVNGALANLASAAAGQDATPAETTAPALGEGIITVVSANDFDTTYNTLVGAINSNEALTLVTELDHSANAANVGLMLAPTRLIVFGNPNLGTPLMQSGQSIGIDLPQKMLVTENSDGVVSVSYNEPAYLAQRHGITDQAGIIETVTNALNGLATGATTGQ